MEQPAAGDVAHEARRSRRNTRPLDARADIVEHRGRFPALFRELRIEAFAEDLSGGPQARRRFDLIEKCERMFERLGAQLAASAGVRFQRRRGFAKPANLGAELLNHAIRRAASTAW